MSAAKTSGNSAFISQFFIKASINIDSVTDYSNGKGGTVAVNRLHLCPASEVFQISQSPLTSPETIALEQHLHMGFSYCHKYSERRNCPC